jgi:hypothetical protein
MRPSNPIERLLSRFKTPARENHQQKLPSTAQRRNSVRPIPTKTKSKEKKRKERERGFLTDDKYYSNRAYSPSFPADAA